MAGASEAMGSFEGFGSFWGALFRAKTLSKSLTRGCPTAAARCARAKASSVQSQTAERQIVFESVAPEEARALGDVVKVFAGAQGPAPREKTKLGAPSPKTTRDPTLSRAGRGPRREVPRDLNARFVGRRFRVILLAGGGRFDRPPPSTLKRHYSVTPFGPTACSPWVGGNFLFISKTHELHSKLPSIRR